LPPHCRAERSIIIVDTKNRKPSQSIFIRVLAKEDRGVSLPGFSGIDIARRIAATTPPAGTLI
jgi:hypothetical protein